MACLVVIMDGVLLRRFAFPSLAADFIATVFMMLFVTIAFPMLALSDGALAAMRELARSLARARHLGAHH
jgi:hypothetical protein